MRELELDFGIEHTGYRLSYFQAFNWGTFDSHIVTLRTDEKNSLLTGTNGSGKTTLVDGLLTLLVPSNYRSYNLSSGSDGKNGRTEESYVLGTYSTEKSENDYSSSRKTLRDKTCHSILLADFSNKTASHSLTLMQIRYFASNGSMRKQFFIIEGDFSIEMMNEKKVGYNTSANWIVDLKKAFPELVISSFDTFKRYSYEFGKLFGFRSLDKALRIFSQTVGMKDLSNLNDFIRTKMLDEDNISDQYKSLLRNYQNLKDLKNVIDKEEKQIEILQDIKDNGRRYELNKGMKYSKEYLRDQALPVWEAQTSIAFINEDIEYFSSKIDEMNIQKDTLDSEREDLTNQIDQITETLASDDRIRQIENLKRERSSIKNLMDIKLPKREDYKKKAEIAGLPFPTDEVSFKANRIAAAEKIEDIQFKIETLNDSSLDLNVEKSTIDSEVKNFERQLDAIANRESNIPLEYLNLRDEICKDVGLDAEDVKYIGELIQVKESCLDMATSIETILNPFALTLIVLPNNLEKVSKWLLQHNLKQRIAVKVIENVRETKIIKGDDKDQMSLLIDDEEILFEEEQRPVYLDMMVEIKENFEYGLFLSKLLAENYHLEIQDKQHVLFDSVGNFSPEGMAHTKIALIKGVTSDECDFRVLGWDTGKKKARLKKSISDLKKVLSDIEDEIRKNYTQQKHLNHMMKALEDIRDSSSFDDIDISIQKDKIDTIDSQLMELNEATGDLEELRIKRDELRYRLKEVISTRDSIMSKLGAAESVLNSDRKKKEQFDAVILDRDLTTFFEPISNMVIDYEVPKNFKQLSQIENTHRNLEQQINIELREIETNLSKSRSLLEKGMSKFVNPGAELNNKYPTWGTDTKDLVIDVDSLNVYESRLEKLENDSLPKFKAEFANLQTRQMKNDLVSLNTSLNRWDKNIKSNINELNESLSALEYQKDPATKIRLTLENVKDSDIKQFKRLLLNAQPDAGISVLGKKEEEEANSRFMNAVETLIDKLRSNEVYSSKVLDVRRWHNYAVEEYVVETDEQYRFYADSAGISGGQKAKLAYTILAAAIAHQFDVFNASNQSKAFRFVIVDEAFSKSDDNNSKYAMNLFKAMDLQLMVVTPMDKVNLVEPYIESIQVTVCEDSKHSFVRNLKKDENHDFISRNNPENKE
ncbi:MAG: hypothetical protein M0P10_06260 [Sphaerochaetaceae bacterium]|nr:hypothetical protein [Sphaerochaetaceae bacterium]